MVSPHELDGSASDGFRCAGVPEQVEDGGRHRFIVLGDEDVTG